MACSWKPVPIGKTGLEAAPLGVASSYGVGAAEIEYAFECGLNYFFWGSLRKEGFGQGIRNLVRQGQRDRLVVAVESYARVGFAVEPSVESALARLNLDHVDVLVLGWWNGTPPDRIVDAALRLKDQGKVRHLAISSHDRGALARLARDPRFAALMVRYNAAHPGAETELFPHLGPSRPGVIAFTATRWAALVNPKYTPPGERVPRGSDCYRFVLTGAPVDLCLCGPKDRAELDEAMAALDRGPLDPEEMAWMRRVGAWVHDSAAPRPGGRLMAVIDRLARLGTARG